MLAAVYNFDNMYIRYRVNEIRQAITAHSVIMQMKTCYTGSRDETIAIDFLRMLLVINFTALILR